MPYFAVILLSHIYYLEEVLLICLLQECIFWWYIRFRKFYYVQNVNLNFIASVANLNNDIKVCYTNLSNNDTWSRKQINTGKSLLPKRKIDISWHFTVTVSTTPT